LDIGIGLWEKENPDRNYPTNKGLRQYSMFRNYSDYVVTFKI